MGMPRFLHVIADSAEGSGKADWARPLLPDDLVQPANSPDTCAYHTISSVFRPFHGLRASRDTASIVINGGITRIMH